MIMIFVKSKKTRWAAASVFVVAVLLAGFFAYRAYIVQRPLLEKGSAMVEKVSEPVSNTSEQKSDAEPIVSEKNGVTEISLKKAPEVVNTPSIEELKEFRKKSEELEQKVKTISAQDKANKLTASINGARFSVEPVYTYEQQKKGLLGRERLADDSAMLYVFQMDDSGRAFGTKGMKFSIDIVWANSDFTIVHITKNVPPDFDSDFKSMWPARYVLEVNAGSVDRKGIRVGDKIDLETIPH